MQSTPAQLTRTTATDPRSRTGRLVPGARLLLGFFLLVCLAGAAGAGSIANAAAPNLVAAFGFDAGSGSSLRDDSGNANTGTISGATWTTAGKNGSALRFDGVNDWVTIADSASLDLTSAMTLEAWVRPTSLGSSWRTALIKEQPGNLAYALYAHNGASGASGHVHTGGTDQRANAPTALPKNSWTHLATTYDGATIRIYANGAQVATRAQTGAIATSNSPLRLGGNAVWPEWFKGSLDDIRVYNRALTPSEIKTDMATPVGTSTPPPPPPVDTQAPTTPTNLHTSGTTQTSLAVAWNASTDNTAVTGYSRYQNTTLLSSATATSDTYTGLTCGSSYTLAVDAYDAAGNRSPKATLTAATSPCSPSPSPSPDTTPPTTPTNLALTGATTTSLALSWSASTDNTAVTGYGRYQNTTLVSNTTGTSHTYSGLACGSSYTLAVDAYDAAGNRSPKATLTAATSPCPPPSDTQAPSVAGNLRGTGTTQTSLSVAWDASTDNVAVTGYGRYNGGSLVSSAMGTVFTFSGLSCGTNYGLAVDAFDAAGNRSAKASMSATTAACAPSTPPPVANLYLSPNGSDTAACTEAAPCRSFARAYTVAGSGDTVSVASGVYPTQFFAGGTGSSQVGGTKTLTFKGQPGNAVRQIHFRSPNLTFDGINVDAQMAMLGGSDGALFENGGEPFTFKNGSIGNVADQKGALVDGAGIVFDNVLFHDVVLKTDGVHTECAFIEVPEGMIIRNSTFRNCAVMDVFFKYPDWWSPPPPAYGNVTLEGNSFGAPVGTYSMYVTYIVGQTAGTSAAVKGWRVRNNSFGSSINVDPPIGTGNTFCGNTGSAPSGWTAAC